MTIEEWRAVIDVNLTGQCLCAQEAIRQFRRRANHPRSSAALGKIICRSSVHQRIPWAGRANYAASKRGLKLLMESIAQDLSPEKISSAASAAIGPRASLLLSLRPVDLHRRHELRRRRAEGVPWEPSQFRAVSFEGGSPLTTGSVVSA
jgi:glucose 1-dehydrogenase